MSQNGLAPAVVVFLLFLAGLRAPAGPPWRSRRPARARWRRGMTRCWRTCRSDRSCSSGNMPTRRPESSATGRKRTDHRSTPGARDIGSIASTGFGLTGLCIAAERGWIPRADTVGRARDDVAVLHRAERPRARLVLSLRQHPHGRTRVASELSSIDSALLLAGVLSVRQCFGADAGHRAARRRRSTSGWISPGCLRAIR